MTIIINLTKIVKGLYRNVGRNNMKITDTWKYYTIVLQNVQKQFKQVINYNWEQVFLSGCGTGSNTYINYFGIKKTRAFVYIWYFIVNVNMCFKCWCNKRNFIWTYQQSHVGNCKKYLSRKFSDILLKFGTMCDWSFGLRKL